MGALGFAWSEPTIIFVQLRITCGRRIEVNGCRCSGHRMTQVDAKPSWPRPRMGPSVRGCNVCEQAVGPFCYMGQILCSAQ
jgi:hypothetical protein